ncbi:MAG: class I SAM-dependent methyltransferase [Candidatus Brockarchaeota archaeon]|nr:class I SAM-dependent methyltransferase [Candidatus Brockarchaeota archaeon]
MSSKKRYVDRFVGLTPKKCEELEDKYKKILEIFSKHESERVLDVGCGDGNFSMLIGEACKAREVYGIEISERGVEIARKNGVKCFQLDVDMENFPFEDNFFDTVFAGELIEHLFDPDHFLEEVYRVLKAEGIFVLSTPNLASIHNRIALLFGYQPFPMGISARMNIGRAYEPNSEHAKSLDHIRVFTLRSLKELLKIHGFKIIKVKGSCAQLPENMRFRRLFRSIDALFAKFPGLSYRVIMACRKL